MVLFFPSQQNDDHCKFVSREIFILHQCFLGGTWGFRYCGFSGSFAKPPFFALALGWFLGIISGFYFFLFLNILICTFNGGESYIKGQFLSVSFQWMRDFQFIFKLEVRSIFVAILLLHQSQCKTGLLVVHPFCRLCISLDVFWFPVW